MLFLSKLQLRFECQLIPRFAQSKSNISVIDVKVYSTLLYPEYNNRVVELIRRNILLSVIIGYAYHLFIADLGSADAKAVNGFQN